MKRPYVILLLLFVNIAQAQTYPFAEGFESTPNSQIPTGWSGSMKVQTYHGMNDLKAICARVSSAVEVDSAVTPLIGPLTSNSTLSFYYRIIDQNIYPSTPTNLDSGDSVEISLSTDGINYHTVYLITMDNHNTSFNFAKKKAYLSQYAGNNANFKIRCVFGSGSGYYVDIDTVVVKDDPQAGVTSLNNEEAFTFYPNPIKYSSVYGLQFAVDKDLLGEQYSVTNTQGQVIERSLIKTTNFKLQNANLFPGMYFVEIGNTTRKLVVE